MYKIIIVLIFSFMFTFISISTCGANPAMDAAVDLLKQQNRQEERGRQQINEAIKTFGDLGHKAKIRRIEKALLKLDTWDRASLIRIMNRYNASLKEMNRAMSNVSSFNRYSR